MTNLPARTASIYVRLSVEASETNLSLDGMQADCLALAEREGLAVVGVYVDNGISGAVRNRPGFTAWLADAREGRASTLIAWSVDRMTREGATVAGLILDTIEHRNPKTGKIQTDKHRDLKTGKTIETPRPAVRLLDTQGTDSLQGESFRLGFVVRAEVARLEREAKSARAKAACRRLAAAGRYKGGRIPYGATSVELPDGSGFVLTVFEPEAAVIRQAARRILAGEALAKVSRTLPLPVDNPAIPKGRLPWSRASLAVVLDSDSWTARNCLDTVTRAALVHTLKTAPRAKAGRPNSRLLSGGLLVCGSCGRRLTAVRPTPKSTAKVTVYRCMARTGGHGSCETSVSVAAELAEAAVIETYLNGWGTIAHYTETVSVSGSARAIELETEISDRQAAVLGSRGADRAVHLDALEALEAERDALATSPEVTISKARAFGGKTLAEVWETADLDARHKMIETALKAAGLTAFRLLPGGRGIPFSPSRIQGLDLLDPAEIDARSAAA